jgi:hypothetical protein
MSGYKPKPRQSYGSFGNYHKKRASTCHYNRGLYWMDPSGGDHPQKGILEFQKAICADPYNEDAKYQLQILESYHGVTADEVATACIALDCSGCRYINAQKS